MKIVAMSLFAIGLGLASMSVSRAMPVAPLDQAAAADHSRGRGLWTGLAPRALWRLSSHVQLPARLAFRTLRPPLLPQLVR
jgi:hypothetical protein